MVHWIVPESRNKYYNYIVVLFCPFVVNLDELSVSYSDLCSFILWQEKHGLNLKAQLLLTVQQLHPGALMEIILPPNLLVFLPVHLLRRQVYLVCECFVPLMLLRSSLSFIKNLFELNCQFNFDANGI